jgi:hypothetical protein
MDSEENFMSLTALNLEKAKETRTSENNNKFCLTTQLTDQNIASERQFR